MKGCLTLTMGQKIDMGQRIRVLSTLVCPSMTDFAKSLGISTQLLNNWTKGKANFDSVELITSVHKQVNSDWLINGNGQPINKDVIILQDEEKLNNGQYIEKAAKYVCSNLSEFARMLGVKRIKVNSWVATGADDNDIDIIVSRFPAISRDYITKGVGKPLLDDESINKQTPIPSTDIDINTIGGRLEYIIANTCKSKVEFSKIIGESPQTIVRWCKSSIPSGKLHKISNNFQTVNIDWLINGNGLPFLDNPQQSPTIQATAVKLPNGSYSPHYQVTSGASSIIGASQGASVGSVIQSVTPSVPREEKASSTVINDAVNNTVQVLTSVIEKLSSQLSDKDKIIMQQFDAIASRDERIRELEKLINNKPTA